MTPLQARTPAALWRNLLMAGLALATVGAIGLSVRLHIPMLMALPVVVVLLLLIVYHYRPVFWLAIAAIPCSLQIEMGGSFAIDIASEPLMLVLMGIFLIQVLAGKQFDRTRKLSVFHILIFLILFWTLVCSITSTYPERSFKFLLSKLWYLAAFIYMADYIIRDPSDIKKIFWAFFIPLSLVAAGVSVLHAAEGFSFESAHLIAMPLYPNGVVYAATMVLFLPWCWYARSWYTPRSPIWYLINAGMALQLFAAIFSYKRGAWLAILLMPIVFLLMKRGWLDKLLYAGLIVVTLLVVYMVDNNRFYRYAPNYQSTIWHEGDLSGHLAATFDGTEISGMERFYRWVAAKNMIADMPLFGAGPSTFNQVYKEYADDAFRTYVSDNPEQSTTHNYFLMTFSEQGFPGGLLFITLCVVMVVKAVRLYPRIRDKEMQGMLAMLLLSLFTILFHSLLNELIEVDKVGAMFWLILLLIHKMEVWHEQRPLAG